MRLQVLYFSGALAVAAIPFAAEAQSLPTYSQPAPNARGYIHLAETCPAGWVWEQAGYLSSGKWRAAHCALRNTTAY